MSVYINNPSYLPSGIVIGDLGESGSPDSPAVPTLVGGKPLSSCLELKSEYPLTLTRLTSDEIDDLDGTDSTVCEGMIAYNTDLQRVVTYNSDETFSNHNTILVSSSYLDAAEITTMYDPPRLLVAAPGAGKILFPVKAILYNTDDLQAIYLGGGDISIQYGDSRYGAGDPVFSQYIDAAFLTSNNALTYSMYTGDGETAPPPVNTGIYISNQTNYFTALRGNNVFVYIYYRILTV